MQICNEVEYEYLIYKQFVVKRLGFIEMCYVFIPMCSIDWAIMWLINFIFVKNL